MYLRGDPYAASPRVAVLSATPSGRQCGSEGLEAQPPPRRRRHRRRQGAGPPSPIRPTPPEPCHRETHAARGRGAAALASILLSSSYGAGDAARGRMPGRHPRIGSGRRVDPRSRRTAAGPLVESAAARGIHRAGGARDVLRLVALVAASWRCRRGRPARLHALFSKAPEVRAPRYVSILGWSLRVFLGIYRPRPEDEPQRSRASGGTHAQAISTS